MLSYNVYTIDLIHVLWVWDGSSPGFWNSFTVRWLLITITDYFVIAFKELAGMLTRYAGVGNLSTPDALNPEYKDV